MPFELFSLRFVEPPELQPFQPQFETLVPNRSPETSSVADQDQPEPLGVEIKDESSPSASSTHEAYQILKEPSQFAMDAMFATVDAVINGMTKMTPPKELNFSSPIPSPTTAHTSTPPLESLLVPKDNLVPKTT